MLKQTNFNIQIYLSCLTFFNCIQTMKTILANFTNKYLNYVNAETFSQT